MSSDYFVNNPVFVKEKTRFDWTRLKRVPYVKSVFINERIVEIPFAIAGLGKLSPGAKVLDIGCSESLLPLYLAGAGYQVTGLDFRNYPYDFPGLEYCQGDILNMPFADAYFDAVTCVSTLEHLGLGFYSDPKEAQQADAKAMAEVRRVLKPGGTVILTVPFGVPQTDDRQRVYGKEGLDAVLKSFVVEQERYFCQGKNDGRQNNFWREVSLDAAAKTEFTGFTSCVCLIRARKK